MLLSYNELKAEVQNKIMLPVADAHVNSSSIDCTLGGKVFTEVRTHRYIYLGSRDAPTMEEWDLEARPYALKPGEFILASTFEHFNLPLDMSAEFRLKSSAGRMGLSHALAVWCDAGWHGSVLTLELHNLNRGHTIVLQAGDRIGQMIFHRHAPVPREHSYAVRGSYNQDTETQPAKGRP